MDLYAKTLDEIQADENAKADKARAITQSIIRELLEDMSNPATANKEAVS